nr:NADH dehydrogenase subunit 4L [Cylindrotaenia sp. MN-2022]
MISLFLMYFLLISISFFLCISRFLNCLIILENYNVLLLLFCVLVGSLDSHIIFIVMIVISTVEVVIGLVVLTRVWECTSSVELVAF